MSRSKHNDADIKARMFHVAGLNNFQYDGNIFEMLSVGVPRTVFDRKWLPSPHMLSYITEYVRPYFDRYSAVRKLNDFFPTTPLAIVASLTLDVSPECYSLTLSTPLVFKVYMGFYTQRRVSNYTDVYHRDTGKLLMQCQMRVAYLVGSPARPVPLPDAAKRYLENIGVPKREPSAVVRGEPPPDTYRYEVAVRASDMDDIYHVNQASYIRYCADAAYEAGKAGKLPSFPPHVDVAEGRVKHIDLAYRRESFAGDELEVLIWETHPFHLQFIISNTSTEGETCYGALIYHPINSPKL